MPLVSILNELKTAERKGYAIPCFDTFEMMGTQGIIDALEAQRAPGIIGLYSGLFDRPHARPFCAMVRALAEDATVPVSIILDHGADFEHCMQALHYGFSDVMYDGSKLPFEENIANTQLIVRAAHAIGAAVEAELGHVGTGRDYQNFGAQGKGFTQPAAVEEFVEKTGVDALAVAVGTAHGLYDGKPRLAIDLLQEIRSRVDIPLVLHGGSGLSDDQFRAAIEAGISKINIFTNLAVAAGEHMLEAAQVEDRAYFNIIRAVPGAFQQECERLLNVFGTVGQAEEDR
jgi:fructose-bisphosphate aldolase class II